MAAAVGGSIRGRDFKQWIAKGIWMEAYRAVVLSGGGSKGAYGLGVLLALDKFHKERRKNVTQLYCGASVGALNATLAAQGDLPKLQELYSRLTTRGVLGSTSSGVSKLKLLCSLPRRPFHYFDNKALRRTIESNVSFDKLAEGHLLVSVTNYLSGTLETFYRSDLVDEFVAKEAEFSENARRLHNYHRIESQEQLVDVLLASSAIPFYFPPVPVGGKLYVDGGVGNNTPLRQAAYMCRFLQHHGFPNLEPTVCVINDPSRFTIERSEDNMDIFGVVRRTLDIFHNELVLDSRVTWDRINTEVRSSNERRNRLQSVLEDLPAEIRDEVRRRVMDVLHSTSDATARIHMPLLDIRPSAPLVDDVLKFDPEISKRLKHEGAADCLKKLEDRDFITPENHRRWLEQIE